MSDVIMSTTDHSWNGLITHTLRKNGTISRARIHELIMFQHCIMVRCKIEGQTKTKDEHPIIVAFIHNMWVNVDVVSEDDLPDDTDMITYVPEECSQTLPSLTLSKSVEQKLTIQQKRAFRYISDKINIILALREHSVLDDV